MVTSENIKNKKFETRENKGKNFDFGNSGVFKAKHKISAVL